MRTSNLQSDIIRGVKNRLERLYHQTTFDRLIILLASLSLVIILVSAAQVRALSIGAFSILVIILFIRLLIYSFRSRYKGNPGCHRGQVIMSLMAKLANEMNVKLHPTRSLDIVPDLIGACSVPWPVFSGRRVHFRGRVRIGCTLLYGLDDLALRGIIAHELAHLKKSHSIKVLLSFLLFVPVLSFWIVSDSTPIIPILLTFNIWALVLSLISWHHEYEADAEAAEHVGEKDMAYALEQVAGLIYRPGDTLAHPSFKKRISRLLSDDV